jgi:hypothetical protein
MNAEAELIRCEDCTRMVPLAVAHVSDSGLICDACSTARATMPPIVMPVWTRLRRAIGFGKN